MSKSSTDLPVDRLTTTDASGQRVYVYPSDVAGRFRTIRSRVYDLLLIIFLVLPWVRLGGNQAVLLDLPRRRFSLFGLTFWAHDAPMFIFVLGGFVITLVFVTAVWGRVWCGWACPQTVFIDAVFRRIERWIEGSPAERKKRDRGPWNGEKIATKAAKLTAFIAATLVISHSFLAYFVGTDELAKMVVRSPADNLASFLVMAGVSLIVLFDFGWFREQFCTIACPYGRFQSVLMDDHSMIIGYDAARGEPRKGVTTDPASKKGDCVNCRRCVQVCPTGIDIRRGVQLECIACTACIDACDDMMTRVNKPVGLIRYTTLDQLKQGVQRQGISIRAKIYLTVLMIFTIGLVLTVMRRKPVDYTFVRATGAPYQLLTSSNGAGTTEEVLNHFKVDLSNQSLGELLIKFSLTPEAMAKGFKLVTAENPLMMKPGTDQRINIFIQAPKSALPEGRAETTVVLEAGSEHLEENIRLVGPLR